MESNKVRTVFIFFFIWLPMQYIVVGIVGYKWSEPWPAFVYPGFKNIYVDEEGFAINKSEFLIGIPNSDTSVAIPPYKFFPEIPRSQIQGFMRTHFSDEETVQEMDDDVKTWISEHARSFIDDHQEYTLSVIWKQQHHPKGLVTSKPGPETEIDRFEIIGTNDQIP